MNGINSDNAEELLRFEEGWTEKMVEFWKERMDKLRVNRTFALRNSLLGIHRPGAIEFRFLEYGIYVANGTGREIYRGNGGDLGFTPKRKAKEWFFRKYASSRHVLNEVEAAHYGQDYQGMLTVALDEMMRQVRTL